MNIEKEYLKRRGPSVATFSYAVGEEKKYKVSDRINGVTVISKGTDGDLVCTDRGINLCPTCVASGWAAKLRCKIPLVKNSTTVK